MISLLLADEQQLMIEGLRQRLVQEHDFCIVAEVSCGREAILYSQQRQPKVVLLDVDLPGSDEVCTEILARCPGAAVVLVSANDWDVHLARGWAAGASAFVVKTAAVEELANIIRVVAAGKRLFTPEQLERIRIWQREVEARLKKLTARQREVLVLLAAGYTNPEIAKELVVSLKTVESHVSQFFAKLAVDSRREAIAWAQHTRALSIQD
jgi:DNA-binding NarL/FixJ family response regulator